MDGRELDARPEERDGGGGVWGGSNTGQGYGAALVRFGHHQSQHTTKTHWSR